MVRYLRVARHVQSSRSPTLSVKGKGEDKANNVNIKLGGASCLGRALVLYNSLAVFPAHTAREWHVGMLWPGSFTYHVLVKAIMLKTQLIQDS